MEAQLATDVSTTRQRGESRSATATLRSQAATISPTGQQTDTALDSPGTP
jgi:hypothetical protein